jgi:uncharacterized protein (DUF4415 family)
MSKQQAKAIIDLPPLTDEEGEVRELTEADFALMRPAYEVLPPYLVELMREHRRRQGERGPQKTPTKKLVSLRLDQDVLERARAGGPGWQTRINDILRDALLKQKG